MFVHPSDKVTRVAFLYMLVTADCVLWWLFGTCTILMYVFVQAHAWVININLYFSDVLLVPLRDAEKRQIPAHRCLVSLNKSFSKLIKVHVME